MSGAELYFRAGAIARPLVVRRNAAARAMRLAVDPRTGAVRLTLPRRISEARARRWAEEQRPWVEAQLGKLPVPRPFAPGAAIPFRGEALRIEWAPGHPRTPRLDPRLDNFRLILGGPAEGVAKRVAAFLRREALRVLAEETAAIAARAGVSIGRVGIGDPRTRWGSCSARGDIRYAWRLILAPPFVLTSTVAHEVAHRLHMNHGADFHAAEARLFGADPAPARAWLREHGAALYWVGTE